MAANFYSELESAYSLLDIEENFGDEFFADGDWGILDSNESFTCSICNKTLKTERGLKRHVGKHSEGKDVPVMDVKCWKNLVQAAVDKIIEKDLQSDEILCELRSFNSFNIDSECMLLNLSSTTCIPYVFDLEKFFPMFYKVVTRIDSFHGLSKDASLVVGFELANHIIAYYKEQKSSNVTTPNESINLDLTERDLSVVTYIAGYVFSNLYRRMRKSPKWQSSLVQQKLSLLKSGKIEVTENSLYSLVKCRDRGGLWYVSNDVISIFETAEKEFRFQTKDFKSKIPYDDIVAAVINVRSVQSSIRALESHASCD